MRQLISTKLGLLSNNTKKKRPRLLWYLLTNIENTSIRMIIAIAILKNFEIHQMDVKTAFLNEDLDEEIYM